MLGLVGAVVTVVVVVTVAPAGSGLPADPRPTIIPSVAASGPALAGVRPTRPGRWSRVLGELDRRRERAFAAGDPEALTGSYVPGSRVLARDRATLTAYARRGLTVEGAGLRLLDVRVQHASAHRATLLVVDRLAAASATTASGEVLTLPRDRPTAHLVTLLHTGRGWRITSVRSPSGR